MQVATVSESRVLALSVLLGSDALAKDIFAKTSALSQDFKLTSPPQYHNFLVNIGLKEQGLCYHWSDALFSYFSRQDYPDFVFHLMVANQGSYWREHNSLLVVAKGQNIEEGIIIDPWRNAGTLYFVKVQEDKAYTWIHRPNRGCE
ncbi:MAG: hypothetical protein Q9M36_07205 [Sulfurovum sp.]|nr:hypothetical protein [Sulfurovum sp.]